MAEGGEVDDWQPPSEAEMKVINARRERQDKISKLMGQYLLKGYKMLGSVCSLCGTILLRDKEGQDYCIACKELTSDTDKDNPVMNHEAAESQVREGLTHSATEHSTDADSGLHYVDLETGDTPVLNRQQEQMPNITSAASRLLARLQQEGRDGSLGDIEVAPVRRPQAIGSSFASNNKSKLMTETVVVLESRIQWANLQLRDATQTDQIIALCTVIEKCVSAIKSIQTLDMDTC